MKFGINQGFFSENPFEGCAVGPDHNDDRQYYVARETIEKVLSVCRNERLKFVVMLARYAGLRIPSEIRFMKFSDFGKDGFFVHHDTKTGKREVPLFKEIRSVLERLKLGSCPGDLIFPVYSWRFSNYCAQGLNTLIRRAKIAAWPRLYNNLRSSCIMDYDEMGFGQKTLDSIFGNSEAIRRKHYVGFRRDKEFMRLLNTNIPIVELLSSLGGTFENEILYDNNIGAIIARLSSLKSSLVSESPEISIHDRMDEV